MKMIFHLYTHRKKYDTGLHAVSPELTQLHDIETVLNIDNSETSRKDTAESLEYLMLLTQKGT